MLGAGGVAYSKASKMSALLPGLFGQFSCYLQGGGEQLAAAPLVVECDQSQHDGYALQPGDPLVHSPILWEKANAPIVREMDGGKCR